VRIAGHGVAVDLPAGWDGRISQRQATGPVMHVATFPLLASDGDYGASATGRMRGDDVFAALLEFQGDARVRPGLGLFEAIRRPLPEVPEFGPMQLQVTRPGQLGWQRFFTESGRALCLYAVIQPVRRPAPELVAELRGVLATIVFS